MLKVMKIMKITEYSGYGEFCDCTKTCLLVYKSSDNEDNSLLKAMESLHEQKVSFS